MGEFRDRVLVPLIVPLVAVALIAVVVLNYSLLLLAIEGTPAVVLAMATASALLGGATWFSLRGWASSASTLTTLALAGIVVIGAGFVSFASLDEEQAKPSETAAGAVQKPGPPDVVIHAIDIGFTEKRVTTPAGLIKIAEVNDGRIPHTLVLEGVPDLKLAVASHGQRDDATVGLKPGTYTYYCDVPGHRQAGMEGVLVVTQGAAGEAGLGPSAGSALDVEADGLLREPKPATEGIPKLTRLPGRERSSAWALEPPLN